MTTRLSALTFLSSRCPTRVTRATRTATISLSRRSVLSRLVSYVDVHLVVYVEGHSQSPSVLSELLYVRLQASGSSFWLRGTL